VLMICKLLTHRHCIMPTVLQAAGKGALTCTEARPQALSRHAFGMIERSERL
jgi:hypothetical protein